MTTSLTWGPGTMRSFSDKVRHTAQGPQLLVPVFISSPVIRSSHTKGQRTITFNAKPGVALVDTGATKSAISRHYAHTLHLSPTGTGLVNTATRAKERVNIYTVRLAIGQPIRNKNKDKEKLPVVMASGFIGPLPVLEIPELAGHDVLIGMDVLSIGALFCAGGHFTLAFP